MRIYRCTLFIILFILIHTGFSQTQRGIAIPGENAQDQSGASVSMGDQNTVAIGAPLNSGVSSFSGHVRVYSWNGAWQQKGLDIDGTNTGDEFGSAVSMANPNRLAVGAPSARQVSVYNWTGSTWSILGGPFNGRSNGDQFGSAVDMPNSNAVAIGAPQDGSIRINQGYVRVNIYNGLTWTRRGSDINGSNAGDFFGTSVAMANSATIAIGAQKPSASGYARVLRWNGTQWLPKGADILGENTNDRFGSSIAMPTENTIAVGAPLNAQNGTASGHVRVFDWNGTTWIQRGSDIDGDTTFNLFGTAISMQDSLTIAISAPRANGNSTESGVVKVFYWNGSNWVQQGRAISGDGAFHRSGESISMFQNSIAIGSRYSNDAGALSGHTRVFDTCRTQLDTSILIQFPPTLTSNQSGANYQWLDCNNGYSEITGETGQQFSPTSNGSYAVKITFGNCVDTSSCQLVTIVSLDENEFGARIKLYPNPTNDKIYVDLGSVVENLKMVLRNSFGEVIQSKKHNGVEKIELNMQDAPGIYFIELIDHRSYRKSFKFIVN